MAGNFIKVGKWGECLWGIDENGNLLIDRGEAVSLGSQGAPWAGFEDKINAVVATREVSFPDDASLSGLFKGCRKMQKADLSGFRTENVVRMDSMFEGCANLRELDLSSFDTHGCTDMSRMFSQCAVLDDILMGDGFSTKGDGSTDCGRLAVKDYGKYKKAKPISVEGFRVLYHSNYGSEEAVEERHTMPGFAYVVEDLMFERPDERSAFMGWNTNPDAEGRYIEPGIGIEAIDRDFDLYAIWGRVPEIGTLKEPAPFTFGEAIPFELPDIISENDPEVTGYLEISATGEDGSWQAIRHDAVLPAEYSGYYLRLHASNSIGEAVSNPVRLTIKRANVDTSGVRWAEEDDMTYDGSVKHVWLEGLPEGIVPEYEGNEASEAGTYTASIRFNFDRDNFNEPLIVREHEWTIRKASYDMSEASWDYEGAFTYDGKRHHVELKGLPEGVKPHYEGNTGLDAGVYTAKAQFGYDKVNYEKPQDIRPCVWEIKKVSVDTSDLEWTDHTEFVYDGQPKQIAINNLPEGAEAEYDGAVETPAGKYLARAALSGNYSFSGPAEHEWEIAKASYDMSGVRWSDASDFVYDGEIHSVHLEGVPEELGVRYSGNEAKGAGSYTARASFVNPDTHNYNTPEDMFLTWKIDRKSLDMSGVRWNYGGAFTYDGEVKKVELEGLPEGVYADYERAAAYDAGIYNAHAILRYDTDNLETIPPADCQWRITKRRIDISDVAWGYEEPFEYDGNEHSIYLVNLPEGVDAEYTGNTHVEAGKYAAGATLVPNDSNNYEVPEINGCTWSIDKAQLKVADLAWTDSSDFVYDGTSKTVEILNDLGDSLAAEYSGNTAKAAGRYYAKAVFYAVDSNNFRAPEPEGYSWTIRKASADMSRARWDYSAPFVYDGSEKSVQVVGLPDGVSAEYINASATDAGTYTAVARLSVDDPDNYEDNIPDMTLDWSISKAVFDMSGVSWQQEREFAYDGNVWSVALTGLPEGLTAVYSDNEASGAGEYMAGAGFTFDEKNYERPEVPQCRWAIDRTNIDVSDVTWDYEEAFVYDGTEKSVAAVNVPEGTTIIYSNASANQAGTYVAGAELVPDDTDNLLKTRLGNLTWRIDKGNYDMSHVRWDYDKPFVYNGSERRVILKGLPEGVLPSYRGNTAVDAGHYTATVSFTATDNRNFNTPDPMEFDWEIVKADYDMSGAFWDYEGEFRYNGRMHEVTIVGLPEGVRAVYSGNAAADTGSYEASAELIPYDTSNYNSPSIDGCSWKIAKADYDMSAVKWDYSGSKTYNGRAQSVMLDQLPNGVSAEYSGNEAADAGSYTAKAVLSVSDPANYNTPSVRECDWEIAKADYDMSEISWDYDPESCVFDGDRKTVAIKKLPENVTASYSGNSGIKAGTYTAIASFETSDSNFNAPEPERFDWEIAKADHDMSGVFWDYSGSFTYDATPKRVELKGIPEGVSVRYENNTATDAGTYTAVAVFDTDLADYNAPADMSCEWVIDKADPDIRRMRWDYSQPFTYDGRVRTVRLEGVPETLNVRYSGDSGSAAGSYTAHAEFEPKDPANYNGASIKDCSWRINKADYDMSGARWEGDFDAVYDGGEKNVYIAGLPEGVTPVYSGNTAVAAGKYSAAVDFRFDADNYNAPEMKGCEWHIGKATYDMSGAEWKGTEGNTYDGKEKSVYLTGLPEGVTPVYSGNTALDAGTYEATAELNYDADNYEKPYIGGCSWNIGRASIQVDSDAVIWNYDGPFVYDGTPKGIELATRTEELGFIDRLRKVQPKVSLAGIPDGFDVEYSGNEATEAGVYYASIRLISRDDRNYGDIDLPRFKWEILKAPIDMSGVRWDYEAPFTFDGEEKCVELTGLPDTVTVSYTDNRAMNAGEYEAMATVAAKDPANYETPAPVSGCWWHIEKASYDMSEVRWDYEEEFVYNGKEKSVRLLGLPEGVRVESYAGSRGTEAGGYTAEAKLRYRHKENFEEPVVPELRWRIAKKQIDLSDVRWDYEGAFTYDDKPKEVKLEGVPEGIEVAYVDNSRINAGTYTARARLIYDNRNCEAPEIPDLKWRISKASYDTRDAHWTYEGPFAYDGSEKSISLAGLPDGISVRYRDNKAVAAGKYTAKAYLTYDSDNYEAPDVQTTIDWEIKGKE